MKKKVFWLVALVAPLLVTSTAFAQGAGAAANEYDVNFAMGPWQAAIAVDWLDVDYALPMHYDTFPPVEIEIEDFEREVAGTGSDAEVHVLDGDETYVFEKPYAE